MNEIQRPNHHSSFLTAGLRQALGFFVMFGCVIWFPLGGAMLWAQKNNPEEIRSGPMVGYSQMREVMLWVQTATSARVQFEYHDRDEELAEKHWTAPVTTEKPSGFTAHCLADEVEPGKRYVATLYINKKRVDLPYPVHFQSQSLWQWRTDPPTVRMAVGSCAYVNETELDRPGQPYGGGYGIFNQIADQLPELMLWLGDNVYFREADWTTQTGMFHRYTYSRSIPELQKLLAQTHHYAIWDDHDFGPNDSDHSFVHKDLALKAFKAFWANPSYGLEGRAGITTQFQWADCDFFLLDNRYNRGGAAQPKNSRSMLGKEQLVWLLDALKYSKAPFKFVCIGGMVLSTAAVYENYARVFPEEREYLLQEIQREKIKGVIFLTGDRHHTELSKWHPEGGVVVYDLTISPLTSKAHGGDEGKNQHLVEGTEITEPNFGILEVSGAFKSRVLNIQIFNARGDSLWKKTIPQGD